MEMPSNTPESRVPSEKKSWLPSRRVGWTLIVLAIFLIVAIFGTKLLAKFERKQIEEKQQASAAAVTDRDTDGDGLPDWQEVLFRLDPEKKDTNDDGIDDKAEFASLRALAKNPTEIDQRLAAATDEDKISLILSDKIGKAIIAGKTEAEIQAEIATTIQEYALAKTPTAQTTASFIITDDTAASIAAYFDAIAPKIESTRSILQDSASYFTETSINAPEQYLARITALTDIITNTPVPPSFVTLQTDLVSSLIGFRDGLVNPIRLQEGNEFDVYVQALIIQQLGERVSDITIAYAQTYQSLYPETN
jgi:hypothetical protein